LTLCPAAARIRRCIFVRTLPAASFFQRVPGGPQVRQVERMPLLHRGRIIGQTGCHCTARLEYGLCLKGQQRIDYPTLLGLRQVVEERQPQDPVGNRFSYRTVARLATEFPSHFGQMQRLVMEYGQDAS